MTSAQPQSRIGTGGKRKDDKETTMKTYEISWTGRKINQKRLYGSFEVLHSSASGWYVFDHETVRVVKDGLANLQAATDEAKRLAKNS